MKNNLIKQDINFLEYPLHFVDIKSTKKGDLVWRDIDGYVYKSTFKPPNNIDALILIYLLLESQNQNYNRNLEISKYKIIKDCDLGDTQYYYKRIEESLKRWTNITIEFNGTFYNGKNHVSMEFHIIENYVIDKSMKKLQISINEKWLEKIKESGFFKLISFNKYKALKKPVSRRLFEVLCKTFKDRNSWSISLTKLGTKLTLYKRHANDNEGKIFASDVLVAIKPAINEINQLNISKIEGTEIEEKDLFIIDYKITGEKNERVITFFKKDMNIKKQKEEKELIDLAKNKSEAVAKLIKEYLKKEGYDYVKYNILYCNENSKKSYPSYFKMALESNYGQSLKQEIIDKEEKKQKFQKEIENKIKEREEEEKLKKMLSEQEKQFKEKVNSASFKIKKACFDLADASIEKTRISREFVVKLKYAEHLIDYFNSNGSSFNKKILDNFPFIRMLELPDYS